MQIEKKVIEQVFVDMRGRAPWNVDGPSQCKAVEIHIMDIWIAGT